MLPSVDWPHFQPPGPWQGPSSKWTTPSTEGVLKPINFNAFPIHIHSHSQPKYTEHLMVGSSGHWKYNSKSDKVPTLITFTRHTTSYGMVFRTWIAKHVNLRKFFACKNICPYIKTTSTRTHACRKSPPHPITSINTPGWMMICFCPYSPHTHPKNPQKWCAIWKVLRKVILKYDFWAGVCSKAFCFVLLCFSPENWRGSAWIQGFLVQRTTYLITTLL